MARKPKARASDCYRLDGTRKTGYVSWRAADRRVEHLRKVWRTGQALHAYPCPECHRWHVGKNRKGKDSGGWK